MRKVTFIDPTIKDLIESREKLGLSIPKDQHEHYKPHPHLLLEDLDDINMYCDFCDRCYESMIPSLMRTDESRWDHLYRQQWGFHTFNLAIMDYKLTGTNPIYNSSVHTKFYNVFRNAITNGPIVINRQGGWHNLTEKHEILSNVPIAELTIVDYNKDICIRNNTQLLNLENDPELEQYTIDNLSRLDENFSYVTNMRFLPDDKLEKAISDFKEKGGKGIWVYTTGSDIKQMKEYCSLANQNKLESVTIVFNAGRDDNVEADLRTILQDVQQVEFKHAD